MDIQDLPAVVFATNQADRVLPLRATAIFAQSQRRRNQSVMTPRVARLAPVMSHSNYHISILIYLTK
jgi:hypothetical protein